MDRPLYDFRTGYPDLAIVPQAITKDITPHVVNSTVGQQYSGDLQGLLSTRSEIARFLTFACRIPITLDEIMIVSGALAGIDVVCRTLTEAGDIVLVEDPTFFFAIQIFKMSHVELVGVPIVEDGIDLNALESLLRRYGKRIRLLYTIPSYQNPTGISLSLDKRQTLISLAAQYGFTILEDTTYQQLYFDQPPPPTLKTLAKDDKHVIAVGSFSKILMPSLRQGWIWANNEQIQSFKTYKADGAVSGLTSEIVAQYLRLDELPQQLIKIRECYARKCSVIVNALSENMPYEVEWISPQGGFFIWITLPKNMAAQDLRKIALSKSVDFLAGSECSINPNGNHCLRLCFSMLTENLLQEGIAILGSAAAKLLT